MLDAESLVGHKSQLQLLNRMIDSSTIPHALLFSGPEAIGKRLAAFSFSASLLAPKSDVQGAAVSRTAALSQVWSNTFPDFHVLAREHDARDISVENVRSLCDELMLKPYYGGRRAAIINDAHRMSLAAANALLKTLEEPPPSTHIILITHAPHRLPPTVVSRCQQVHFAPLPAAEISAVLQRLLAACGLSGSTAKELSSLCDGTLSALQLDPYLDPATSQPNDIAALTEHFEELSTKVKALRKQCRALAAERPTVSNVTRVCQSLFGTKEQLPLARTIARQEVRRRLLEGPSESRANALIRFLEAERLIDSRSAQAELQLSAAMIQAYCR
ncbi:MAG: hypothetical protein KDD66_05175 [Bdellovibrionales bacterium]|nr:hypothetical protein [Bdellovibrionales bacterium]